jgi:predicted ATPase/DNA-binding CsgD family transcriptional regulator
MRGPGFVMSITAEESKSDERQARPPLIGRERELHQVNTLLNRLEIRLLTLSGAAGIGKSRLAHQIAAERQHALGEQWVIAKLTSLRHADLLPAAVASAFGLPDGSAASLPEAIGDRRVILLLDDFEQLMDGVDLISSLLAGTANLKIVVTSRVVLRISAEYEFPVPPLAIPETGAKELECSPSVELFVQRARAVRPDFSLNAASAATIAEICRRLDGLPLAIELAAARIKVLSPKALLSRLDNRLQVLTGGARDLPPRLQTMRDAIAWSYDLLKSTDQCLFRRLAIFSGPFSFEAAESVSGRDGYENSDVFEGIATLVDSSLLLSVDHGEDEQELLSGFVMMGTIREFALEQLALSGREETVRLAHANHYLELAEQIRPDDYGTIQERHWLDRLEAELDNLRAALDTYYEIGDGERLFRLTEMLGWYWYRRGHFSEGRAWLDRAIELAGTPGAETAQAKALLTNGKLSWKQADYPRSFQLLEHARSAFIALGDRRGEADSLLNLGVVSELDGNEPTAAAFYEQALTIYRELGDTEGITNALVNLGDAAFRTGDFAASDRYTVEALETSKKLDERVNRSLALGNAGQLAITRGDLESALLYYRDAARLMAEVSNSWLVADTLPGFAEIARLSGEPERGIRWLAAAQAICDELGTPSVPHHHQLRLTREQLQSCTETAPTPYASLEELTADILTWSPAARSATKPLTLPKPKLNNDVGLTARELDVLLQLAEGKSSREIGDVLSISHRTASTHVSNIFSKLGVDNRAAAVAKAFQAGLFDE